MDIHRESVFLRDYHLPFRPYSAHFQMVILMVILEVLSIKTCTGR
jgi:hypothetical protein